MIYILTSESLSPSNFVLFGCAVFPIISCSCLSSLPINATLDATVNYKSSNRYSLVRRSLEYVLVWVSILDLVQISVLFPPPQKVLTNLMVNAFRWDCALQLAPETMPGFSLRCTLLHSLMLLTWSYSH